MSEPDQISEEEDEEEEGTGGGKREEEEGIGGGRKEEEGRGEVEKDEGVEVEIVECRTGTALVKKEENAGSVEKLSTF